MSPKKKGGTMEANKFLKNIALVSTLIFQVMPVHGAQKNLVIGQVSLAGEGCLRSSHKLDQAGRLRIIPQGFLISSQSASAVQRKACTFSMNFSVNKDTALRISLPSVSGIYKLGQNSSAHISYETFFTGTQGEKLNINLEGDGSRSSKVFNTVGRTQQLVLGCGSSGIIRGNISLMLNKGQSHEVSSALIKEFGLKVETVSCL